MLRRFKLILNVCLLISYAGLAQEINVHGQFQTDSIKIGVPIAYSLSAQYPKNNTILFPDSTFGFDPYEIAQKKYFPTTTKGNMSYDSVVYYLTSFEIDSIQTFSLPVFIVNPTDCTAVYANADTVFLQQLIKHLPDSVSIEKLPLKTNTAYQTVSWLLNYPFLLIVVGSLIVLSVVIWILFGKRIRRYLLLRKLNKNHTKFLQDFEISVGQLEHNYSTHRAEATLRLWKQYMERLQASPYTKFTTKEIFELVKDEKLASALKQIDRTIYRESNELPKDPLLELQNYSEQQYHNKLEEIKNG